MAPQPPQRRLPSPLRPLHRPPSSRLHFTLLPTPLPPIPACSLPPPREPPTTIPPQAPSPRIGALPPLSPRPPAFHQGIHPHETYSLPPFSFSEHPLLHFSYLWHLAFHTVTRLSNRTDIGSPLRRPTQLFLTPPFTLRPPVCQLPPI